MIGKVPPSLLEELIFDRTGASDERVIQGPAYGEDTAAIRVEDGILVINADPISLAVGRIGTLAIHIAANDVAASGAQPAWLTSVMFLPDQSEQMLTSIIEQMDETARSVGISIIGGHSEYAPHLQHPLLVLTCLGMTDRYVPTGGARPGDRLIMTKSAGIEATAILSTDFAEQIETVVPRSTLEGASEFYDRVSVIAEATLLAGIASAMHDPTEGGLVNGLIELAVASNVSIEVDRGSIPVAKETKWLCDAVGINPFNTFGSGALLATIPEDAIDKARRRLTEHGIQHEVIGYVADEAGGAVSLDGEVYTAPIRDEMYALWE